MSRPKIHGPCVLEGCESHDPFRKFTEAAKCMPPAGDLVNALLNLANRMERPSRGGEQRLVELPKFNGEVDDPHQ
ncbi:11389_t:CDS:2 [Entrophospora sp. SA101]|nr:11389_t:CDS:2 [Entrophospora sp. SA101]